MIFTPEQIAWMGEQQRRLQRSLEHSRRAFARQHPRDGQPWSIAEDKCLRKLVEQHFSRPRQERVYKVWARVGRSLGRTAGACSGRWYILKVVDQHAQDRTR